MRRGASGSRRCENRLHTGQRPMLPASISLRFLRGTTPVTNERSRRIESGFFASLRMTVRGKQALFLDAYSMQRQCAAQAVVQAGEAIGEQVVSAHEIDRQNWQLLLDQNGLGRAEQVVAPTVIRLDRGGVDQ